MIEYWLTEPPTSEVKDALARLTSMADIQQEMVKSEQGVQISELKAQSSIKAANGQAEANRVISLSEADAIRSKGQAKAEAYEAGVQALGGEGFTAVQLMQIIGEQQVRVVPDVSVSNGKAGGVVDGLLGLMLKNKVDDE